MNRIHRCKYKSDPEQLAAISSIAKAMDFPAPADLLEYAAISLAEAELDHLPFTKITL